VACRRIHPQSRIRWPSGSGGLWPPSVRRGFQRLHGAVTTTLRPRPPPGVRPCPGGQHRLLLRRTPPPHMAVRVRVNDVRPRARPGLLSAERTRRRQVDAFTLWLTLRPPPAAARGWSLSPHPARSTLANSLNCSGRTAPRQPDDLSDLRRGVAPVVQTHDQLVSAGRVHLRRPSSPQKAGLKLRGSGDLIRAASTHALKRRSPSPVTAGTTSGERLALPLDRTR
jgi:hypothetical protein